MTNLQKHVEWCAAEVRNAIAPLTAPDAQRAADLEAKISRLIDAKLSLAMDNMPRYAIGNPH